MKNAEFPLMITEHGVTSKVRRVTQSKNGKEYVSFIVEYCLLGKRKQEWITDLDEAKAAAREACRKIAFGEAAVLQLTQNDRLAHLRAVELLAPFNISLDVAALEYTQAIAILGSRDRLLEAARDFVKRNTTALKKKSVPDAVQLMVQQLRKDKKSEQHISRVESILGRFTTSFNVEVDTLTPKLISDYLVDLPFQERTKANHRDMLRYFFRWCVTQQFLPKDADLLSSIQKYSKRKYGAVEIFIPEEMALLLSHASDDLIPFLALCGFAGLRSIEVQRLDWSKIDFGDDYIEVDDKTAKQHEGEILRRLVPMSANLKAWLSKVKKSSGPVCPFKKVENELDNLCAKSGVKWKHNALRHSAISYRIAQTEDIASIAYQSGNSPDIIEKNYLSRRKPWQAAQWFGIMPGEGRQALMPAPEQAKIIAENFKIAKLAVPVSKAA